MATKTERAAASRAYRLQKLYNLSVDDWNKIFAHQNGLCAICDRPATDFMRGLHVDHDHATKAVRGLLCWNCNSLLPNRKNLAETFAKAIAYLNGPPADAALGETRIAGKPKRKSH